MPELPEVVVIVAGLNKRYQQFALAPFSHANGAPLIFFVVL
jgi:hypothetical protein